MKPSRPTPASFCALESFEPLEPRALLTASWTFFGPEPAYTPTPAPPVFDRANNSVVADFDSDGIPDLATASGNTISFAKGLSDGSFEANRTTTLAGPVGFISAGHFDGTGVPSLIAVGTRGGAVLGNRPNPGFRLRSIAFDPTAHADINGAQAGAFVYVAQLDVPDFRQHGALPIAVVGDMLSGWRDEFALNLQTNNGENRIAIFEFKNRTTIVRRADFITGASAYSLAIGDVLGTGKGQIVYATTDQSESSAGVQTSTIRVAAPSAPTQTQAQTWSSTPIRTFPAANNSLALGDIDGDHHTDIVALPVRNAYAYTGSDARMWLIRSFGDGAFAAPIALTPRIDKADWSLPADSYDPGVPTISGIGDLNGDARPDVLISSWSVWNYRIPQQALLPTAAIQGSDGKMDVLPIPHSLNNFGSEGIPTYVPAIQVIPPVTAGQPPSLLVTGLGLIRAATAQQKPEMLRFYPVVADHIPGQSSVGLPATFAAKAFDAESLRGGNIDRVEFYIDVNHDHMVDVNDILVGAVSSPDADGSYTLITPVDASWGASPGTIDTLAIAIDNTGLASDPAGLELDL